MEKPVSEGHVVRDFMLGNTHVQICDDYCKDRTPDEVQAILDRIASNAMLAFAAVGPTGSATLQ